MPLGASVTYGLGSTTGDSYRKELRDRLVAGGTAVEMVGSQRSGDDLGDDGGVEATPGFVIEQIAAAARTAVRRFRPNLVLLDAGTNNCNAGGAVPDAGRNVSALLDGLYRDSPGAAVVLATVLATKVPAQDRCRRAVNEQFRALAAARQQRGDRLVLVDMRSPAGPTTADLFDSRHPNDEGYRKMATVWFQGILEARDKGFLTPPADVAAPQASVGIDALRNDTATPSGRGRETTTSSAAPDPTQSGVPATTASPASGDAMAYRVHTCLGGGLLALGLFLVMG